MRWRALAFGSLGVNLLLAAGWLISKNLWAAETAAASADVDQLLLQVMPDREKVGRLARLAGTLRYAREGGDQRLVDETVDDMQRVAKHLGEKFRPSELIDAASSTEANSAQLAQLYIERCYRLVDEDYAALAELDSQIEGLKSL